jgi:hypothetical protein
MKRIFFFLILFSPVWVFGQKKYVVFPIADTSSFHIRPGFVTYTSPTPPGCMVSASYSCYCDSTHMDTIYNALKFDFYKIARDSSKPVSVEKDQIWQDGKIIGYFHFTMGSPGLAVYSKTGPAISFVDNPDDNVMIIWTSKDDQKHSVIKTKYYEEEVAEFLVKQGYL